MPQTVLTLAAELDPDRVDAARDLIERLRETIQKGALVGGAANASQVDPYQPLVASLPGLHFASLMIFEDERFDPLLTLELNFDGLTRTFLPSLQTTALTPYLRAVLRCCKPPEDATRLQKYRNATGQGPLAPYLETLIVKPAVYHQGNRGLDRDRIIKEANLFEDVQNLLDAPTFTRRDGPVELHRALRELLLPANHWLGETAPDRVPVTERAADIGRLAGLILLVVGALLAPGVILARALPLLGTILICGAFAALVVEGVRYRRRSKPVTPLAPPRAAQLPPEAPAPQRHWIVAGAGILLVLLVLVLFKWSWLGPLLGAGLGGLVLIVIGILHMLRRLERTDRVHQKPKIDPDRLREIMELEDHISQNHMGSVVHVKPGVLRAILIRLGLHGLGLLLRVKATDGYLANMRTIHFAHWALLDNGSRLVFFSNFDSSWESYLDDFIEKAHQGLTLAWSNGIGFPRARFLIWDGATNGPLFKTWARHSMARGLFWVSAYPKLSVNQIERNFAIALGLRAPSLSLKEAEAWAALL